MEEAEVIDIDDLLGSSSSVEQEDPEEYDFENFPTEAESLLNPKPQPPSVKVEREAKKRNAIHGGIHQGKDHAENYRPKKLSLADDSQSVPLPTSSTKQKPKDLDPLLNSTNNSPCKNDEVDVSVDQNEALLDAFIHEGLLDCPLPEDQLCIDVNSEELRRFILEFESQHEGKQGDIPDVLTPSGEKPKREIALKYGPSQSEDQDSLNSSISTTESRDGSLTSSLASSDLSPVRTKQKVPRCKSVRFLMSNLLRNHRASHHLPAGRASGSDEDSIYSKRHLTKTKDRNKKRDKEMKFYTSREVKTQPPNSSASSAKGTARPTCTQDQLQPKSHPRIRSSKPLMATPLSPGGGDGTLHKQLIQAATRGDLQVLEFLLAANEGLSKVRDDRGNSLLHIVTRRGHVDCLAWLAAGPCTSQLAVENDDGFTPAALAVKHGQLECIRWLVEHSEASRSKLQSHDQLKSHDLLESHDHCWYLLHLAARFGQEPCLRWLLEHMQLQGISLDQADHGNNNPAHLASKYGHLHCIQTLVEFNCDVTSPNKKQQTPYTLAMKYCHDACAQFLIVVETCIKLSNQLVFTQKQLRGSQQENEELTKKLREALSCTDALVHMQKTDLSQRIDHLQAEYVELTDLLVHQLGYLQQQQQSQTVSCLSREDVLVSHQKADQLKHACSELLDLEQKRQKHSTDQDHLKEIERRLSRLQPVPTTHIWSKAVSTDHGPSLPLEAMRTRLSEVAHEISSLHHPTPNHTSWNLDTLSLSSSSCTSSVSSSSVAGGTSQSYLGHAKKPQVPLNHRRTQLNTKDTSEESKTVHGLSGNFSIRKTLNAESLDFARGIQDQTSSNVSQGNKNTDVQYIGGALPHTSGIIHAQSSKEHLKSSILRDMESDPNSQDIGSKVLEQSSKEVARKTGTLPPSYKETCSKCSKCSLRVQSPTGLEDMPEEKTEYVARKIDQRLECQKQVDLKSHCVTGSSSNEETGSLEAYFLPHFNKSHMKGDVYQQVSAKYYALQQKHGQQAMPGFMRKVQPTNEFGEPESGNVIVKISSQEEMVVRSPVTSLSNQDKSSHQHADSNSSMSSQSSDHPWLESDPEESVLPTRPQRGGILAKKNADGSKRSQDRHITFALDSDEKPTTMHPLGKKPLPGKQRGLSPISEAPDLVKSTNDDGKSLHKGSQKIENKDSKENVDESLNGQTNLLGYSRNKIHSEQQKVDCNLEKSSQSSLKYHEGLSDDVSREFSGVRENDGNARTNDDAERLWYESSDDETDASDVDSVRIPATSKFERHVCYL